MKTAASGFECLSAANSDFVKTVTIDPNRHNPCVGLHYGQSELGRLLIVGMSHYGTEADVSKCNCTEVTIRKAVTGEWQWPTGTSKGFPSCLVPSCVMSTGVANSILGSRFTTICRKYLSAPG